MIRLISIFYILLIFNGCTWIEREYYYKNDNNQTDWNHQFFQGEGGGKRVQLPAKEVLTYTHDKLELSFHISYLDITVVGPVIIPFIPTPWDSDKELAIDVEIYTDDKDARFDLTKWKIKTFSTRAHYPPLTLEEEREERSNNLYEPTVVIQGLDWDYRQRDTHLSFRIKFPVKLSEIDEIEIDVGTFKYKGKVLTPSIIKLIKREGDWYWNGFTV